MLRIDSNVLWTIINLLVLYALMKKFLFKPVREIIAKRNEEIDSSFADAAKDKETAQALKAQADEKLATIHEQCNAELAKAKTEASQQYEQIIADANAKSEEMIAQARLKTKEAADQEKIKAQNEMAAIIDQAAKKVVGQKSDADLYDDFIKEMDEG